MTTYTAVARRAGDWWAISVPELKGVHTQARRLSRVEAMARDAIALMLDVPPDLLEPLAHLPRSEAGVDEDGGAVGLEVVGVARASRA